MYVFYPLFKTAFHYVLISLVEHVIVKSTFVSAFTIKRPKGASAA